MHIDIDSTQGPPDRKTRASVFKAILRDVKKDSSFDCKVCAAMTEGYTPSDITALCGAAVSAVHTERSTAIHRNRSAVEKMLKKGKADGTDVKGDSTKSSEVPLRALRIAVSTLTVRQTDRQTDRHKYTY